jgi:hypothetical protein
MSTRADGSRDDDRFSGDAPHLFEHSPARFFTRDVFDGV